jgi:phosphoribosyl 1,2-cyclic phosphodiesterase
MIIKLYGVRGSLPAPLLNRDLRFRLREILRLAIERQLKSIDQIDPFLDDLPDYLGYTAGGDTTCITVRHKEELFIIDAGTGLRVLGDELISGPAGKGSAVLHIFLTHTHWDHIQGLPFFKPLYIPGNEIHFYSPLPDIEERLAYQTDERFFPMPFHRTGSTKFFHRLEGPLKTGSELIIDTHPLKHPGGSYAYRFRDGKRTFIFATDAEFTGDDLLDRSDHLNFFSQADLLILDTQYTLDESFLKIDWGHTSVSMAVNCAVHWKVKNLVLTHHEPAYSDRRIYENYENAIEHRRILKQDRPRIYLAREGTVYHV